jgi:hypothetical protein
MDCGFLQDLRTHNLASGAFWMMYEKQVQEFAGINREGKER